MTEPEVEDWLSVAVTTVLHYPAAVLDKASLQARRTCTHHSQIVPTIIREAEELLEAHHRLAELRSLPPIPEAPRLTGRRLTQEDCDVMPLPLRRVGLKLGELVENPDGSVSPAPPCEGDEIRESIR